MSNRYTRNNEPQPKTVLRWNGQEIQYNDRDREFVHEMLGSQLGIKNVGIIQVQQTHKPDDYQCVIVSLPEPLSFYETEQGEIALQKLVEEATPIQQCFMLNYSAEEFVKLQQRRNSRLTRANVFDLFAGYQPEPEPVKEDPTLA